MARTQVHVRLLVLLALSLCLVAPPGVWAAQKPAPSFRHGLGQVFGGLVLELPKTTLSATMEGPLVAGTMVGLLAGAANALRMTVGGVAEMAAAFNPWGLRASQ